MLFSSAFRFVNEGIPLTQSRHIKKLRVTYEAIQVFSPRYTVFTLFTLFLNLIYTFFLRIIVTSITAFQFFRFSRLSKLRIYA